MAVMPAAEDDDFDPDRFVDREEARRRFQELLEFRDDRRLLVVVAPGGAGKSGLLQRFWWSCMYPDLANGESQRPASRIPLDQFQKTRAIDLVQQLRADLNELKWEQFEEVHRRWLGFDMSLVGKGSVTGVVDATGATITGGTQAGVYIHQAANVSPAGLTGWPTAWHEAEANQLYLHTFCANLKRNADCGPVVLIFDAYDRGPGELRAWIEKFVGDHCFELEHRPAHLLVVLACRELSPVMRAKLRDKPAEVIETFEDRWDEDLTTRFLEAKGFSNPTAGEIAMAREDLNDGRLQDVVQLMTYRRKLRPP